MKKLFLKITTLATIFLVPLVTLAQLPPTILPPLPGPANFFLKKFIDVIVNPLILLLFACASLLFVYGLFEFIRDTESSDGRQKGGRHIMYSIIGFAIIFSVFGIIKILTGTFNIPNPFDYWFFRKQ